MDIFGRIWKNRVMNSHARRLFRTAAALALLLAAAFAPLRAERVSVRLSLRTYAAPEGDIDAWLSSYNDLWASYGVKHGGTIQGAFEPPRLGSSWEVEVRFPLFAGLALDLGGSVVGGAANGRVQFQDATGAHTESDDILNDIQAVPLRIGLSFTLPVWNNLRLTAGAGRHLVFARYRTEQSYEAVFKTSKEDYRYWFKRGTSFRSESLGGYWTLGFEYLVLPFLAVGVDAEKDSGRMAGFKGRTEYSDHTGRKESGAASLYFFESDEFGPELPTVVLGARTDRPEG
jgi:hypothetical protein